MSYLTELINEQKQKNIQAQKKQQAAKRTFVVSMQCVRSEIRSDNTITYAIDPKQYDTIIVKPHGYLRASQFAKSQTIILEAGASLDVVLLDGATLDVTRTKSFDLNDVLMLPGSTVYARSDHSNEPRCPDNFIVEADREYGQPGFVKYTIRQKTAFDYLRDIVVRECDESIKQIAEALANDVKDVEKLAENNPS